MTVIKSYACCQIVAVDMAVYPPSYGVQIGDNIRETEAVRLKTRSSDFAQHNAWQPASGPLAAKSGALLTPSAAQGSVHSPASSDGDFDDFQGPSHPLSPAQQQSPSGFDAFQTAAPSHHSQQQTFGTGWSNGPSSQSSTLHTPPSYLFAQNTSEGSPSAWQQDNGFASAHNSHKVSHGSTSNWFSAHPSGPPGSQDPPAIGPGSLSASWGAPPEAEASKQDEDEDEGFGDFAEAPPSPRKHGATPPVSDR